MSGENAGADEVVGRLLIRPVLAAAAAFIMYAPAASALLADDRTPRVGFEGLDPMIHFVAAYLIAFPVGALLLRLVRVRPSWAIAPVGQLAFPPILALFARPGGMNLAAWQYGLEGALAYALAAAAVGGAILLVALPAQPPGQEQQPQREQQAQEDQ